MPRFRPDDVNSLSYKAKKFLSAYLNSDFLTATTKGPAHHIETDTKVRAAYFQNYRDSISVKALECEDSMDSYLKTKQKDTTAFDKVEGLDKKPITDKLNTTAGKTCKDKLDKVFNSLAATTDATKKFTNTVKDLNQLMQEKILRYSPAAFMSVLKEAKDTAVKAIENQQAEEIKRLTDLFDGTTDHDFCTKMKALYGLTTDAELNSLKDQLMDTMRKNHKDELDKFKGSAEKDMTQLAQDMSNEEARISVLGDLYWRNWKMRREIDALRAQHPLPPTAHIHTHYNGNTGDALLKGINIDDLPILYTITGREIQKTGAAGSGAFSMKLSKNIASRTFDDGPNYHEDKALEQDLWSLAMGVRACGYDVITMEVTANDPKEAEEIGRKAYEACIIAGFDPKNIHIKVNGELKTDQYDNNGNLKTAGKLFDGHSARKQLMEKMAKDIEAERQGRIINPPSAQAEIQRLKKELAATRAAAPAAPPPPMNPSASSSPSVRPPPFSPEYKREAETKAAAESSLSSTGTSSTGPFTISR